MFTFTFGVLLVLQISYMLLSFEDICKERLVNSEPSWCGPIKLSLYLTQNNLKLAWHKTFCSDLHIFWALTKSPFFKRLFFKWEGNSRFTFLPSQRPDRTPAWGCNTSTLRGTNKGSQLPLLRWQFEAAGGLWHQPHSVSLKGQGTAYQSWDPPHRPPTRSVICWRPGSRHFSCLAQFNPCPPPTTTYLLLDKFPFLQTVWMKSTMMQRKNWNILVLKHSVIHPLCA